MEGSRHPERPQERRNAVTDVLDPINLEKGTVRLLPGTEPMIFRVREIDEILKMAVQLDASDIVLGTGESVWVRIHGNWLRGSTRTMVPTEIDDILNTMARTASASAQTASGKDMDFRYDVQVERFKKLRFRVNATSCQDERGRGVEITLRSIPGVPPTIEALGLEPEIVRAAFPLFGLVLVTGPVGSGKTTLLASLLAHSATHSRRRILTYESPAEFDLKVPGRICPVTQTEIPADLMGGWPVAIRNSLRRASDLVLVGESRDRETFSSLIEGSETGVAIYSTSHTNGVVDTVSRIVDVFPWVERDGMMRKMFASLRLIVNQRLFPSVLGGRVALREYLEFTPALRKNLLGMPSEKIVPFLTEVVSERGQTLSSDARKKHSEGKISDDVLEEILRTLDAEKTIVERKNLLREKEAS